MPGCDIVERISVDPATANDADRIVEGLHAKPGQRIFEQDPDGRACAGKREDHTAPRRLRTALDSTGKLFDVMAQTRSVGRQGRSEEHTSELQSLMRISYAVFCLKKKTV